MAYCVDEVGSFTAICGFEMGVHAVLYRWRRQNLGSGEDPLGGGRARRRSRGGVWRVCHLTDLSSSRKDEEVLISRKCTFILQPTN